MERRERIGEIERNSTETEIVVGVNLEDSTAKNDINTSIPFLDHMLDLFAFHGHFYLNVQVKKNDLKIDIHHTNEDIGICLGQALKKALGKCVGIKRFGSTEVPMDQARAKVVVDISNRYSFSGFRFPNKILPKSIKSKENYSLEDATDLLESFAKNMNINLHIDIISGTDLHHVLEAVFKALGLALYEAMQIDQGRKGVPSTKGIL